MLSFLNATLGATDLILLGAVGVYVVDRTVDALGWSRSSQTLRTENQDLVRRNEELEQKVGRMDISLAEQTAQLRVMEVRVEELKGRDQLAVIQRLDNHELYAAERHGSLLGVLQDIATTLKGGAT